MKLLTALRSRAWPLATTLGLVAFGMAFSFWFLPLGHHVAAWQTPGDLWATFRDAQYVTWGGLAAVYGAGTALVTLPTIAVLLAPVAGLADLFHLTNSFPFPNAHPTAWLLLGPVTLLSALPLLTALNRLADDLGASAGRRRAAVAAAAGLCFPVLVLLGHPEDVLSLALALYAARALVPGRTTAAAWLFGASLAVQPVSILVLPLFLGFLGARRALPFLVRAATFPAVMAALVLAGDPRQAWYQLVRQPNYPTANANHPTPWMALAPHLSRTAVSAGPGREVAIGLACLLVFWGLRHRGRLDALLVGSLLAFALRPAFEAVMVPYYLTPALVLAILLAARGGPSRLLATAGAVLGTTVVSFFHYGPWSYWALVTGGVATAVALGAPARGAWSALRALLRHRREETVDEPPGVLGRVALG